MSNKQNLPERLQYLQPFQAFLSKISKEDVGESTDTTILEELLRTRIEGLSIAESQRLLTRDLEELESHLGRRNDRLQFVVGFLLIAAEKPEELLKPPAKPPEITERLTMATPPDSKVIVDQYSMMIRWKRQTFTALRLNMDDEFGRLHTLEQLAQSKPSLDGPPAVRVEFGEVAGIKSVSVSAIEHPKPWKRVDYLLQIPDGYVRVTIVANRLFDESTWESCLPTLRFIN